MKIFFKFCGVSCGFNFIGQPKKKISNRRRGDAEIGGGEDSCWRE
jgi:hypothetical protein